MTNSTGKTCGGLPRRMKSQLTKIGIAPVKNEESHMFCQMRRALATWRVAAIRPSGCNQAVPRSSNDDPAEADDFETDLQLLV